MMELARELAFPGTPQITKLDLLRDGFNGSQQTSFRMFVAVDKSTGGVVGFAFFPLLPHQVWQQNICGKFVRTASVSKSWYREVAVSEY